MQNLLIIDMESLDKYLSKEINLGEGWVYAIHNPNEKLFRVLGWGIGELRAPSEEFKYFNNTADNLKRLQLELKRCDGIIGHNLQYEIGCLKYLGIDIKDKKLYDTMIIAKLYDNTLFNYSLEALSERYLDKKFWKDKSILINAAIENHLCDSLIPKKEGYNVGRYINSVEKWCYANMDVLQKKCPKAVGRYCIQDLISTKELFKFMVE